MTQSPLEDLQALLLLSRTPGIRMHGLRPFFEMELAPSEIQSLAETFGILTLVEEFKARFQIQRSA